MKLATYQAVDYITPSEPFHINKEMEADSLENCTYHTHDFVEICYVAGGSGMHMVNGNRSRVAKGDLFIINYNMQHVFYREEYDREELYTYNIVFKPSFFDHVLSGIGDLDFSMLPTSFLFMDIEPVGMEKLSVHLSAEDQRVFDELLNNIYQEYMLKDNGHISIIRAYMIQLIVKIVRCLSQEAVARNDTIHKSPLVGSILSYLKEHYSEKINLDDIVIRSFFSKGYLCRIFKETTGMTMYDYVQMLRVDEACSLLQGTRMKMTDIAYKVGFADYKSFNQTFRKITGKRPNEYRWEEG